MLIRIFAALVLLLGLWALFRLAMGLRYAKLAREEARAHEEGRGRHVVVEIPVASGLELFLEDATCVYWSGRALPKSRILGGRLLLSGGLVATANRANVSLPDLPPGPLEEGRARWEVVLYLEAGDSESIACGALGEGVSREIAGRVFEVVRRAIGGAV